MGTPDYRRGDMLIPKKRGCSRKIIGVNYDEQMLATTGMAGNMRNSLMSFKRAQKAYDHRALEEDGITLRDG
jgi:hypothetical protein